MTHRTLLLVALVVVSMVAPFAAPATASTPEAPPGGMVGVPDSNIEDIRPSSVGTTVDAGDLSGAVYVSDKAASTEVAIATGEQSDTVAAGASPSDVAHERVCASPAAGRNTAFDCDQGTAFTLIISDDDAHAGRTVAIETSVIKDALGYVPSQLTVRNNETGERWTSQASVEDGWLVADVQHFSSNTVTWSGEVNLTGSPAADGTQFQYNLSDLDSASDPVANLTGHVATDWDNATAAGLSDGGTIALDVAGNLDPTGPSNGEPAVEFTGINTTNAESFQRTGTHGFDTTTTVSGNDAPSNETLTITGYDAETTAHDAQDGVHPASHKFTDPPAHLDEAAVTVKFDDDTYNGNIWVNVSIGGTQVASKEHEDLNDDGYDEVVVPVGQDTNGQNVTIKASDEYEHLIDAKDWRATGLPPQGLTVYAGDNSYSPSLSDGETVTYNPALATGSNVVNASKSGGGPLDYELAWDAHTVTEDPSIDIDGDGTDEASVSGLVADGTTVTRSLSSLSTSDDTGTVSLANGTVDTDVRLRERTQTVDPSLEVNDGNWLNHSGSLADGNTVSLTGDAAWLAEGTNTVNVSVGDGTLSADAPTPSVDVVVTHDAESNVSTDYVAEKWSERYNVSKTFASDRSGAQLTIPFAGEVVQIRDVEVSTDGSDWTALSSYTLDGTTLTADVGDVSTDETVRVRANGSKVNPVNMSIDVLEPSSPGERLDSRVSVTGAGEDPRLELGTQRLTYAYDESWSADERAIFDSSTQTLEFESVSAGAEFQVSTIPVTVSPDSGDVAVTVPDPMTSEPSFYVRSGASTGDQVSYTFEGAKDGADYILWSKTHSVVRDSGTASSPITLTDDDSEEFLQFQLDDDSSSDSTSGDQNPTGPINVTAAGSLLPVSGTTLLIGGLLVALVAFVTVRRQYGATPAAARESTAGDTGLVGSALAWTGYSVQSMAGYLRSNPYMTAGIAVAGILALFAMGVFTLGPQLQFYLAAVGTLLATYLVLTRTGEFTLQRFGLLAGVVTILALEVINPGSISNALGSAISGAFAVLIVAAIVGYWLYSKRQKAKAEASTPDLVFKGGRR